MDQNRAQQAFATSNRLDFRNPSADDLYDEEGTFDGVAIYDTNVIYSSHTQSQDSVPLPNVQTPKTKGREVKMYSRQPVPKKSLKKPITTEYAQPMQPIPLLQRHRKAILLSLALFLLALLVLLCFLLVPRRLSLLVLPPQKESDNYGISSKDGLLSIDTSALVNTRIKNGNFFSVQLYSVRISFSWITRDVNSLTDFAATSSTIERKLSSRSITDLSIPLDFIYSGDINNDPLLQDFLKRCYTDNKGLDIMYVVEFELSHLFTARKTQTSKFKTILPCPMSSRLISDTLSQLNMTLK